MVHSYNPFGLCLRNKGDRTKMSVKQQKPPIFLLWNNHLPPAQCSLGWDPYHLVSFAGCFGWSLFLRLNASTCNCLTALSRSRQPGRQVYCIELKKGKFKLTCSEQSLQASQGCLFSFPDHKEPHSPIVVKEAYVGLTVHLTKYVLPKHDETT